jgi:hypothetical protein
MSTERLQEIHTFEVRRFCNCGGELNFGGMTLLCNPPLYPHKCSVCGAKENLDQVYPHIRHVPIVDDGTAARNGGYRNGEAAKAAGVPIDSRDLTQSEANKIEKWLKGSSDP